MRPHRRTILRGGLTWGAVTVAGGVEPFIERLCAQPLCDPAPLGELLGLVPLHGDQPQQTPLGRLVGGSGLDARLFTDISALQPEKLVTPTAEMFVRTAVPKSLRETPASWVIAVNGFASAPTLDMDRLRRDAKPMGAHLIECSGNSDPNNFGLMSVIDWAGVPVSHLVKEFGVKSGASSLLVSGVDDMEQTSRSSLAGASWIFPIDQLEKLGTFLAVSMNGTPLTPDHGAPVRLAVPGWYGCAWIKWVNELRLVGANEKPTSQMIEFSMRTHQPRREALAREYEPPVIDLAATPIRVEKRRVDGRLEYRIVGIVWGGDRPADRLAIRFTAGETPRPFALCPVPATHRTWSLWDYRWRPTSPGIYSIALRATDPAIRTRRLDLSYYVRRVIIDEI
jgi:DMSO/TMAO reductase YedYZ molybdopterin-dependent catalytic subunit